MNVVLAVDAIRPPLTGIGRYAWELATHYHRSPSWKASAFCMAIAGLQIPRTFLQERPGSRVAEASSGL
ncbi:hypothetical protein SY91_01207 [Burkholderia cenocepacia]|nr:hypothetical protein SY91_01207 [Burkholderia cenocepacia]